MKITCVKNNLEKAVLAASRVVSTKPTLPILNNLLLSVDGGRLKVSATDLEVGLNYWVGAKIDGIGGVAIPAKLFLDFISNISEEKIDLVVDNFDLKITGKGVEAIIKGFNPEEFPLIPSLKKEPLVIIPTGVFQKNLSEVVFAASIDDARPVLAGVYFNFNQNNLKIVATDSYRLAERKIKIDKKTTKETSFIIPTRVAQELTRLCKDEGEVKIVFGENQVLFDFGDFYIVSRVIDGQYPNYEQIIPETYSTKAKAKKSELEKAVKLASFFAKEAAGNIKIEVKNKKGIFVGAQASQIGSNKTQIEAEVEGQDLEILFNAKYILDMLSSSSATEIILEFNGRLSPGVFKPFGDQDYIYIIMPLRG